MGFNHEEESEDSFFVSWSDLVTLLLVFFVYLYSISEIDIVKFLEATGSMNDEVNLSSEQDLLATMQMEKEKLLQMQKDIEEFIQEEQLEEVFSVEYTNEKLELNLGNVLLFEQGSAELKTKAKLILTKVGELFKTTDGNIIVEGHTDDIPIKTKEYPSNWELSSARASSVVRFLGTRRVKEDRFLVIGYNQFRPLAPNINEANRSKNRRVKITLKPDREKIIASTKRAIAEATEKGRSK
jgi:chemotaxis protein MotB